VCVCATVRVSIAPGGALCRSLLVRACTDYVAHVASYGESCLFSAALCVRVCVCVYLRCGLLAGVVGMPCVSLGPQISGINELEYVETCGAFPYRPVIFANVRHFPYCVFVCECEYECCLRVCLCVCVCLT
jgi:hypothetical protein